MPLRITDTTLRDAHQSLWATRMRTCDILNIIDTIDNAGYYSLEVWGGATFDVCLRFLRENPWERLRLIKKGAKKTPLQMLLRGQNILGYRNYPDDVLDRFIALACENGIDIFRIFDALNDTRNLEHAIKCVKQHGGHAQGTICYTISPVHTVKKYVQVAKEQVQMGIDSLCIKDMAGILSPISAEKLISALMSEVNIPIQLHCHATSGMASATYVEGIRAGAGAIDCAISPMAGFSSQPPVETMLAIFEETPYHANLDIDALRKICKYFTDIAPSRQLSHHPTNIIDPEILIHHIPGGMISNLRNQLQQQNALDKLDEVLAELPRVRADMGYPPLVTPTSQIVGVQAVMNVIAGERYAMIPQETKDYVQGLYGRSPAPMDPEIKKKILGKEKAITCRPADLMEPLLPKATKDIDPKLINNEEDIISYCLFPEQALEYFKWRLLPSEQRPPSPADQEREKIGQEKVASSSPHPEKQFMGSKDYKELHALIDKVNELHINEIIIKRDDVSLSLKSTKPAGKSSTAPQTKQQVQTETQVAEQQPPAPEAPKPEAPSGGPTIDAPLHGTFYISSGPGKPPFVKPGDMVKAGDPVCIVEAMKLFNQIKAASNCQIVRILVEHGKPVQKGQPMLEIKL
ncbi:MAG: acetyl-CoA carboxylase, biotin carboxyl carrier protein [Lentisphaerae bacterium RIFOXYA12_FULL_48_11]|nr:MAG: acetyl-CoA carboxylase, biotin carboxyl carrier protein [Lentisphaerae bacterium RIFOXYA12_FULL_48_11]